MHTQKNMYLKKKLPFMTFSQSAIAAFIGKIGWVSASSEPVKRALVLSERNYEFVRCTFISCHTPLDTRVCVKRSVPPKHAWFVPSLFSFLSLRRTWFVSGTLGLFQTHLVCLRHTQSVSSTLCLSQAHYYTGIMTRPPCRNFRCKICAKIHWLN